LIKILFFLFDYFHLLLQITFHLIQIIKPINLLFYQLVHLRFMFQRLFLQLLLISNQIIIILSQGFDLLFQRLNSQIHLLYLITRWIINKSLYLLTSSSAVSFSFSLIDWIFISFSSIYLASKFFYSLRIYLFSQFNWSFLSWNLSSYCSYWLMIYF